MLGKHRIEIYNNKVKYDFEIKRNITIIRGDSATGKTQLISMIDDYSELGQSSGITLICDKECMVLSGRKWKDSLSVIKDSIIFIDEGNDFIKSKEFASQIKGSSNYFVIITREKLSTLPYSIYEIYGIREHGKYPTVSQIYNEMYHLYSLNSDIKIDSLNGFITEDEKSGYQFFKCIADEKNKFCISANGKSQIIDKLIEYANSQKNVVAIVDGVAFGSEMEEVIEYIKYHPTLILYTPESFEWIILKSGIISGITNELVNTYDYAESSLYFSWEQYYTELLRRLTEKTTHQYNKDSLHEFYLTEHMKEKIMKIIEIE